MPFRPGAPQIFVVNQLPSRTGLRRLLHFPQVRYVWLVAAILMMASTYRAARWRNNDVFVGDMGGYYLYLPSAFLTHDLGNGAWVKAAALAYRPSSDPTINMVTLPNGKVIFKYPLGMAVAYAPFFFLAKTIYYWQGVRATTGYEPLYQYAVTWGCLAYLLLGLWVLGSELRRCFDDGVAALTLLIIAIGTNLFTYGTSEVLMAHGTLLLLNALLLRYTRRWYDGSRWPDAVRLGLVSGLMVLVRPSELMLLGIPVLWGLNSRAAVAEQLRFWQQRWPLALLMVGAAGLVAGQQFVFWRLVAGQWLVPFYPGEAFHFDNPHVFDGVFSFRKGWLVYSPLMVFSLLGIGWVRRWAPAVWMPLLLLVPMYFYVTFCWYSWEYGGSYGGRALISLYPLLAFSLAAFWQRWLRPGRWVLGPLVAALLLVSLIQNYEYLVGLISCCEMTWQLYKERFLLLGWPQP